MTDSKIELSVKSSEAIAVYQFIASKPRLKSSYVRVFTEELIRIAIEGNLTQHGYRLLLALIGHLEYENYLNITQAELAEELGIAQQHVSKALKQLISGDIIRLIGKIGRQNIYIFNPYIAFRSRAKNFAYLCHCWDEGKLPNTQRQPKIVDVEFG